MAFVRFVMRFSTDFGSMRKLSGRTSAQTGTMLLCRQAMPWNWTTGSQMISSPGPAPMAAGIACISSIAVAPVMACLAWSARAKSWRNWSMNPPRLSQKTPLPMTFVRLRISASPNLAIARPFQKVRFRCPGRAPARTVPCHSKQPQSSSGW